MRIKYNTVKSTITIDDNLKWNYFLIRTTVRLTLINSILFPLNSERPLLSFVNIVWIILGTTSFFLLLNSLLKKSTACEISASEIAGYQEKKILGRKYCALLLKNGKKRDLHFEDVNQMVSLKEFLATHHII